MRTGLRRHDLANKGIREQSKKLVTHSLVPSIKSNVELNLQLFRWFFIDYFIPCKLNNTSHNVRQCRKRLWDKLACLLFLVQWPHLACVQASLWHPAKFGIWETANRGSRNHEKPDKGWKVLVLVFVSFALNIVQWARSPQKWYLYTKRLNVQYECQVDCH